jgi:hypothetical protein
MHRAISPSDFSLCALLPTSTMAVFEPRDHIQAYKAAGSTPVLCRRYEQVRGALLQLRLPLYDLVRVDIMLLG